MPNPEKPNLSMSVSEDTQDPILLTIESGPKSLAISFWQELLDHQITDSLAGTLITIIARFPKGTQTITQKELIQTVNMSPEERSIFMSNRGHMLRCASSVTISKNFNHETAGWGGRRMR